MSPRISFSNDFAESSHSHQQRIIKHDRNPRDAPVSSDFEFSVANYSMMSADELFSQGRLLPFKESCTNKTTLREELLAVDEDDSQISVRPPKGSSTRWKGLLGLRKTHIGSKKTDKGDGSVGQRSGLVQEETHACQQGFTGSEQ
ncbi:unnamed protein product [Ilex paraguariensis]|uniref:Uncharacterized protein n=1 Tax=Ilex paraguariensis TaxID=185542 RepID=A0ABC8TB12_9AQUA